MENIEFTSKEVTEVLLKSKKINEGYYYTVINPDFSGAVVSPEDTDNNYQAIMTVIKSFSLLKTDENNPLAVDASTI